LISKVQFNQSGKLFYQLECKQQELSKQPKSDQPETETDEQAALIASQKA